jgi:hypothetical protein
MSLPNITFNIASNGLGRLLANIQKIPGLVVTGVTVAGANKVTAGNSYQIFSLPEAVALGIEETGTNAFAYKQIKDFYDEAGEGAELWLMVVVAATTMEQMTSLTENYAKKLVNDAGGRIRVLGIAKKSGASETITEGLDGDAHLAAIKAQALSEDFASKYMPIRTIIAGNKFDGMPANLKDHTASKLPRVAILLSNNDASKDAAIGLALGRIASIPVQRKINRVKDGPIVAQNACFTNGSPVESLMPAWNSINDKGYIFLRSFAGRTGYYFTGDPTLTAVNDDFSSLARGFVMDKAVLLAYNKLVDELSDEVPVTASGTIHPAIIKAWQNNVDREIRGLMVNNGELSDVQVFIDENQNILTTGKLEVGIKLLPVGYADYITVNIGFTTSLE